MEKRPGRVLALTALALVLGLAACASSGKPALDPDSAEFFRTARLIMTGAEQEIFEHLPDAASRREFREDFWARRNPDPTSEANSFRQEFERRIEYADKHFIEGRKGSDTDRGRIYVYLGAPDRVENFPFHQAQSVLDQAEAVHGPIVWWVYYRYELGIAFADYRNNGVYKMYEIEGNLLEAVDQAKLGALASADSGRPIHLSLNYDRSRKAFLLKIPVKDVDFKDEKGRLSAGFSFDLCIYKPGQAKERLTQDRTFSGTPEEVQALSDLTFELAYDLPPGKCHVDVILIRDGGLGKVRRIFAVKN